MYSSSNKKKQREIKETTKYSEGIVVDDIMKSNEPMGILVGCDVSIDTSDPSLRTSKVIMC